VQTAELKGTASENTGIAAVVPSQKILDILDSPRAKSMRDLEIAQMLGKQGKFKEAFAVYEIAIQRMTDFDRFHPLLAALKMEYGKALTKSGDKASGEQKINEAKVIHRFYAVDDNDRK
jgi:hypothetical protein